MDYIETSQLDKVEAKLDRVTSKEDTAKLEGSLREEIARVEGSLKTEIASVKADIIKWMFLFWIGQVAMILAMWVCGVTSSNIIINSPLPWEQ